MIKKMANRHDQIAYRDLQVWEKSMVLANLVIKAVDEIDAPRKHFRMIEQLESAVTSIPMNIAEGKGRNSKKEFIQFLYISRGSIYETLTLLEIFQQLGWLSEEKFNDLERQAIEIIKMIKGLINAISRSA
ncbi:MAG TPA: four helix bundle protein [Brevefilum fermentans]|jgi:four helix bundle protein|nr:four helix bundle protein [Brevefilum fermentans]